MQIFIIVLAIQLLIATKFLRSFIPMGFLQIISKIRFPEHDAKLFRFFSHDRYRSYLPTDE